MPRLRGSLEKIGFPFTYEGVAANTYADLTARYVQDLKGQLLDSAVTTWTVNGKLYGLPINVAPLGNICYNKKAFDAAGVKYPTDAWTGDDFRAAANWRCGIAASSFAHLQQNRGPRVRRRAER